MLAQHRLVLKGAFHDHVWLARSLHTALFFWIPAMAIRYQVGPMPEWYEQIGWLTFGGIVLIIMLGLVIDYAAKRNAVIEDLQTPRLVPIKIELEEVGFLLEVKNTGLNQLTKCSVEITKFVPFKGSRLIDHLPHQLPTRRYRDTPRQDRAANCEFDLSADKPEFIHIGHLENRGQQQYFYLSNVGSVREETWCELNFKKLWVEFALYSSCGKSTRAVYLIAFGDTIIGAYRWHGWPSIDEMIKVDSADPIRDNITALSAPRSSAASQHKHPPEHSGGAGHGS